MESSHVETWFRISPSFRRNGTMAGGGGGGGGEDWQIGMLKGQGGKKTRKGSDHILLRSQN